MEFLGAVGGVVNVVDDLFESSSSDESLMSDECDDNDTTEHLALLLPYREEHEKQCNYRYMDVIKNYSALDHWRHFRVTPVIQSRIVLYHIHISCHDRQQRRQLILCNLSSTRCTCYLVREI